MSQRKEYCQYADVFYGNGEVDHFAEEGLASKWFAIKAMCGNTTPHAVLPFGKMSVGAYSGGYPTGYGCHYPNSCGGIRKLSDQLRIRGFSHLHQSGTGAIEYYYNYAVTTPFYGGLDQITQYHEAKEEQACPGYYAVSMQDIRCELTVTQDTALHRYRFGQEGGRVAVDFSNDGLARIFGERYYGLVREAVVTRVAGENAEQTEEIHFTGILSGVRLYFAVKVEGVDVHSHLFVGQQEVAGEQLTEPEPLQPFGAVFDVTGREAIVKVSYSTISAEAASAQIRGVADSFEQTRVRAYECWNQALSVIDIETDESELLGKFYSNLYHSLIKPCDMTGEEVLGVKDDVVEGFATFWDQYKTLYPLLYLLYPQMGEKMVRAIIAISKARGRINCSFGLSDILPCEMQAKMLGILTLCDAFYCGIEAVDQQLITECMERELARDDFQSFLEEGVFERYTHILDTTDACLAVAELTQDKKLKEKLVRLAENWRNAYDEDGLMSEKSRYYEGDRYTYSFRLQKNMQERIALAGGAERFVGMLDDFFGFAGESLKPILNLEPWKELCAVQAKYHRFEGFNNECDMEAPYAYIYAGRHDRTCEIVREAVRKVYTTGRGALPGNNDSGGLSSCFVWNVLGIFPASGTGEFLLGCPQVKKATLKLRDNRKLQVRTNGEIYDGQKLQVLWNGRLIADYRIPMSELVKGGILEWRPLNQ